MNKPLYKNLFLAKEELRSIIIGKAGVYQLINLTNNKSYVGSSNDLLRRLNEHMSLNYLKKTILKGESIIHQALLKYGYANFGIRILEIINIDSITSKKKIRETILSKEQFYLDSIKPEYNINKTAGSNLGRIFSDEIRKKMSIAKINKPNNKLGVKLTNEQKALFREVSGMATPITMLSENNEVLASFKSIQIASELTGISRNRISRCARGIRNKIIEKGIIYKFIFTNKENK
jgi:hypothetical protein